MKRRQLLQTLSLGITTVLSTPSWAINWNTSNLPFDKNSLLTKIELDILANIVEAIIPTTDTKGAKELGVHQFVEIMVKDCYEPIVGEQLKTNLKSIDDFSKQESGKSIAESDAKAIQNTIIKFTKTGTLQQQIIEIIKQNTIKGYLNSEYVMTNLRVYQMIPGKYTGEVKV